ncbi:hypothetical protein IKE67_05140 [bacterium]|nr:hypothetical protein [bacterium]
MSFDVNPLNNNVPHQIRTSKSQDGGAGNTGYFQQRKKQEDEDENSMNRSLFNEKDDTFTLEDAREVAYVEPTFLMKVIGYVKATLKNLVH